MTNTKRVCGKQQRIKFLAANSDAYRFFNLLTSPDMLSKIEQLHPEVYRERQFPPTETLSMFLAQAMSEDRSCQKVVNDVAIKRLFGGLSPCSTATGDIAKPDNDYRWRWFRIWCVIQAR